MNREAKKVSSAHDEAVAWHTRLQGAKHGDNPDIVETERFQQWLSSSAENAQEYERVKTLWQDMDLLAESSAVALGKKYARQFAQEAHSADDAAHQEQPRQVDPESEAQSVPARSIPASRVLGQWLSWLIGWRGLSMASVAVAIAAVVIVWLPEPSLHYQTGVGEQRTVTLADGTHIRLNTSTSLEVSYTDEVRKVLLQEGQASFNVAPDANRPFRVNAGNGEIQALGTAFDIYKTTDAIKVTLLEGAVEVRQFSSGIEQKETPTAVARLQVGEQVAYSDTEALSAAASVNIDQVTAWHDGKIYFDDTPLKEAVAELNRYSNTRLILSDNNLADLQISGVFEAGKIQDMVRALGVYFNIQGRQMADGNIVLSKK